MQLQVAHILAFGIVFLKIPLVPLQQHLFVHETFHWESLQTIQLIPLVGMDYGCFQPTHLELVVDAMINNTLQLCLKTLQHGEVIEV